MKALLDFFKKLDTMTALHDALKDKKSPVCVTGFTAGSRAPLIATLSATEKKPLVLVCSDDKEAEALATDLSHYLGEKPPILPSRTFFFHEGTASRPWEAIRLALFYKLGKGEIPILICTLPSLLQRSIPPKHLANACRVLQKDTSLDLTALTRHLVDIGYSHSEQVEGVGQFALRGGILDVYSPGTDYPVRIEFWGDDVDSMGYFDPNTQRRIQSIETTLILPAREVISPSITENSIPDLLLGEVYDSLTTGADYFTDSLVICLETAKLEEKAKAYLYHREEEMKSLLEEGRILGKNAQITESFEGLFATLSKQSVVYFDAFSHSHYPLAPKELLSLTVKQLPDFQLSLEASIEDLQQYKKEKFAVVIFVPSQRQADALQETLRQSKIPAALDYDLHYLPKKGQITIAVGSPESGLEFPTGKFVLFTYGSTHIPKKKSKAPKTNRERLESFSDLNPDDLVVHEHHGLGRFVAMVKMEVDGTEKDYIKLQFSGSDVLYVPAMQLDLVSKYIGSGGDSTPSKKLSKLGGVEWEKAKTRARKATQDLAKGLVELYAQRLRQEGYAFSPDSPWQREFEEQFDYVETDDQLRCIEEIKRDMERSLPMDRLLCGDVGYGKTEVAFRAVMKCILDGKQAAILAPTTVLAQQHYLTAKQRFRQFPVEIEMVSRFRTTAQSKDILSRTKAGSVDILIGTHKLLSKNTSFKDLGLLIVDEEQRFGVTHKEKLKEMFRQVDVLVLSATPIPRTLNMALSGLRDMSTLEEAPSGRRPVQTYVLEHDWLILADAMARELARGGQVFYLHNRVETIDGCAFQIKQRFPDATVAVAHGKMNQEQLGAMMEDMRENTIDILVCTTIIETGVDLPNVNTLIIEDADTLGLSQLHQLRGRVGRSSRRAAAYFTFRKGKALSEVANRRMSAIREFAAFGAGFKIAMRDLEIRGAGNLLGPEQSGFLMSVGYDMYLRLLEEAVLAEQGKPVIPQAECTADLPVAGSIPDKYIPSSVQRMDIYRRIARIRTEDMASEMLDELIDRYGDPPKPVANLITVALLRSAAAPEGITDISYKEGALRLSMPKPNLGKIAILCGEERFWQKLIFSPGEKPYLSYKLKKGEDLLKIAKDIVIGLEEIVLPPRPDEA